MASPAQIEANRLNALKSTGPRTAEGKDASRRNAIKHGLAAETLILPDEEAEAVAHRVAEWSSSLNPSGERDDWLVVEVAVSTVRIDRCLAVEQPCAPGRRRGPPPAGRSIAGSRPRNSAPGSASRPRSSATSSAARNRGATG